MKLRLSNNARERGLGTAVMNDISSACKMILMQKCPVVVIRWFVLSVYPPFVVPTGILKINFRLSNGFNQKKMLWHPLPCVPIVQPVGGARTKSAITLRLSLHFFHGKERKLLKACKTIPPLFWHNYDCGKLIKANILFAFIVSALFEAAWKGDRKKSSYFLRLYGRELPTAKLPYFHSAETRFSLFGFQNRHLLNA